MGAAHYVPLSSQAIGVLEDIRKISGKYLLVFPGDSNPYKPMSENTVNKALRTMGYNTQTDVCLHGFRAMACSALTESGLWSRDAVRTADESSREKRSAGSICTSCTAHAGTPQNDAMVV